MLVEFEKQILTGGIFFKLGAKTYFGIEKISFFWNYIDPWLGTVGYYLVLCGTVVYCGGTMGCCGDTMGYCVVLWGYYRVLHGNAGYCWLLWVLGSTGWYWGALGG